MTDNEFDRKARAWLEEGPASVSDRALYAALEEIHVTRQRSAWWPGWRLPPMSTALRLAAGAAAVVVATVVGIFLAAPGSNGVGGGARPTPTPTPRVLPVGDVGVPLEPGTYVTEDPFRVRVTLTVPAGWTANIGGPYGVWLDRADGPGTISFSMFEKVFGDPCHYDDGLLQPAPGPSVDDLANALTMLRGLDVTTPTDVTVSGYRGKRLMLTAPASTSGCTLANGYSRVWQLPLGATNDMAPGQVDQVWILNVDGERLVIDAQELPGQAAEATAEISAILDSIRVQAIAVSTDRGRVPAPPTVAPGVSPTVAPGVSPTVAP